MNTQEKLKMKRFLKELKQIKGRHTELVSVFIPKGYDLNKIISHLAEEQHTASNIKDSRTRKNVQDSLEKCIRHLRLFKKTPENGLAVFAGNASENVSKIDIKVWSIEPPDPLNFRLYRCDQTFLLDPLKEMLETTEIFGLIVLDRREGNIGLLKGTVIEELTHMTSGVPGKTKAGGQSAQRFERIREEAAKEFFNRIGDAANKAFLEMKGLRGILVGGPGPTKEDFLDGAYLNEQLKRKVITTEDLGYTGEFGLQELVDKAQQALSKLEIAGEKAILKEFFTYLAKEEKKVAYGDKVDKVLKMGAIDRLLLSEDLDDKEIEEYEEKAANYGTEIVIISVNTREGEQLKTMGGKAAILRYAV